MELKAKTVMEGKLDSSKEMFRSAGNIKKKNKKSKSLVKAIKKILENGSKSVS